MVLRGNGVSPGVVRGSALKLDSHNRVVMKIRISEDVVDDEVRRFVKAVRRSRDQLEGLKSRFEKKVGREHSYILDAHLLMLEDRALIAEITSNIRREHANAEWAVLRATDRIRIAYESLEDEYFRERGGDIENVVERILFNLSAEKQPNWSRLPDDLILVSKDFNPATFAIIDLSNIQALALETAGRTS